MNILRDFLTKPTDEEKHTLSRLEEAFKEEDVRLENILPILKSEALSPHVVKQLKKMGGNFLATGYKLGARDRWANMTGAILECADVETAKTALEIYDKDYKKFGKNKRLDHAPFTTAAALNPDPEVYEYVVERAKQHRGRNGSQPSYGNYMGDSEDVTYHAALRGNVDTLKAIDKHQGLAISAATAKAAFFSGNQEVVDEFMSRGALDKPSEVNNYNWNETINSVASHVIPHVSFMADRADSRDAAEKVDFAVNAALIFSAKGGGNKVIEALCDTDIDNVVLKKGPEDIVGQLLRASTTPIEPSVMDKLFQRIDCAYDAELSPEENTERTAISYIALEKAGYEIKGGRAHVMRKVEEMKMKDAENPDQKQEL